MTVKIDTYKGLPIFQVWENEGDKFPVFSCGIDKATAILSHIKDLENYKTKFEPAYRQAQADREAEKARKKAERESKKVEVKANKIAKAKALLVAEGLLQ
jgi:hypothetical protein